MADECIVCKMAKKGLFETGDRKNWWLCDEHLAIIYIGIKIDVASKIFGTKQLTFEPGVRTIDG